MWKLKNQTGQQEKKPTSPFTFYRNVILGAFFLRPTPSATEIEATLASARALHEECVSEASEREAFQASIDELIKIKP